MHKWSEMNTFNQPGKAQNSELFSLPDLCYNHGREAITRPHLRGTSVKSGNVLCRIFSFAQIATPLQLLLVVAAFAAVDVTYIGFQFPADHCMEHPPAADGAFLVIVGFHLGSAGKGNHHFHGAACLVRSPCRYPASRLAWSACPAS